MAPASTTPAGGAGGIDVASLLGGGAPAIPSGTTWIRASHPNAAFTFEVPSAWTDQAAYPWEQGGSALGTVLAAGPDLARFASDFSVPAVAIGLSANQGRLTPRQIVEADAALGGTCTAGDVQEATDPAGLAAFQLWESCGGGTGFLLVMGLAPATGGLIGLIFQGASEGDLGFFAHIAGSLEAAEPATSPAPVPTSGGSDPRYSISIDVCVNQHGQGVAEGLITNQDGLVHTFRIVVAFTDPNGVLLNDTWGTTPSVPPGVTAKWQAVLPSGLPSTPVRCTITAVEISP